MKNNTKTWYVAHNANDTQGLIVEETTGKNIAVSYDVKDAPLIADAPRVLNALTTLVKALDNVTDLLVEGLTDTQNENWGAEIDTLLSTLEEVKRDHIYPAAS